jgi:hypothetical protein
VVVATLAPLYSGPFVEAMSPGDFGGCLDSMLCPRSAVPDRPKMHDNVCKAVVEGVCVFGRTLTEVLLTGDMEQMILNFKMPLSQAASRFLHC